MSEIHRAALCVFAILIFASEARSEDTKTCDPKESREKLVECLNYNIDVLNKKLNSKVDSAGPFIIRNRNEGECLVVTNHAISVNKDCTNVLPYQFELQ